MSYAFDVNDTTKGAWLQMSVESDHLHFTGQPDNTQHGDITLIIKVTDPHSDTGVTEDNVTI